MQAAVRCCLLPGEEGNVHRCRTARRKVVVRSGLASVAAAQVDASKTRLPEVPRADRANRVYGMVNEYESGKYEKCSSPPRNQVLAELLIPPRAPVQDALHACESRTTVMAGEETQVPSSTF